MSKKNTKNVAGTTPAPENKVTTSANKPVLPGKNATVRITGDTEKGINKGIPKKNKGNGKAPVTPANGGLTNSLKQTFWGSTNRKIATLGLGALAAATAGYNMLKD